MVPLAACRPSFTFRKRLIATLHIIFLLIFCPPSATHADYNDHDDEFCPIEARVDLTQATRNASGFLAQSGEFFPLKAVRFRAGSWRACICDLRPCLPICPPPNMTMTGKTHFADDYVNYSAIPRVYKTNLTVADGEDRLSPEQRFHLVIWEPCKGKDAYVLEPEEYESDKFYLLENGTLFLPGMNDSEVQFLDSKTYCLQLLDNGSSYTPELCFPETEEGDDFMTVKYVGLLVSVPFLVVTVIVYSVLTELKNIYGTTLRCYLCCLIVTYIALAALQIFEWEHSADIFCLCLGFTMYSAFLASFFWLNVMCFDMWSRFGGFGTPRNSNPQQDRKQFVRYSIYAWGIPAVFTAICIGMEFFPGIPESLIRPGFRLKSCWFATKAALVLYFYGPVGVNIACNICFFILTSIKVIQYRKKSRSRNTSGKSGRHDDNKKWFGLHIKLFVVMGISWSTEIISGLWEGPKYLWFITDMVNVLQGVLIFVIFVCKKKIWFSLKERFNKKKLLVFDRRLPGCICVSRNTLPDSSKISITGKRKNPTSSYSKYSSHATQVSTLN